MSSSSTNMSREIVQAKENDARAEADHEALSAVHELTKHIAVLQDQQIQILEILKPASAS